MLKSDITEAKIVKSDGDSEPLEAENCCSNTDILDHDCITDSDSEPLEAEYCCLNSDILEPDRNTDSDLKTVAERLIVSGLPKPQLNACAKLLCDRL